MTSLFTKKYLLTKEILEVNSTPRIMGPTSGYKTPTTLFLTNSRQTLIISSRTMIILRREDCYIPVTLKFLHCPCARATCHYRHQKLASNTYILSTIDAFSKYVVLSDGYFQHNKILNLLIIFIITAETGRILMFQLQRKKVC